MDPNATVALMNTATTLAEAVDAAGDLRDWLDKGGFQPDWNKMNRQAWKALMITDAKRQVERI